MCYRPGYDSASCADCHFVCEGDESAEASLESGDFRCEREDCQEDDCWCYGHDYQGAQCYEATECAGIGEEIDVVYECREEDVVGDHPGECEADECFCVNRHNVGDGEFDFCYSGGSL